MRENPGGEELKGQRCFRCGKELPPGSLTYVVNIRVFAGFDGVLFEPEEGVDKQLQQIFEQIQQSDPNELEKEVYEEFTLILCKSCRDRFVKETQHPWEGPFPIRRDPDRFIH
jgi:hypothetical protein